MPAYEQEIAANFKRADQSIQATKDMTLQGYYDFAASPAYYAAFLCSDSNFTARGTGFQQTQWGYCLDSSKFVKTGKLAKERGKDLNWLFEIRNIGDYGGTIHVSEIQAEQAIEVAGLFLKAARTLVNR